MSLGRVFVAGHRGMVGSAIVRRLEQGGEATEILTATRDELDLTNQRATFAWLEKHKPDVVIIAAAKVGGIHANNTYRADFIYQNLAIETNLIHGSYLAGIQRILFLGSSCIYPKMAPQPMPEDCLLTGPLEPTNEPYAIAKIAGIKMCESYNIQYGTDYRSVMPTNLYGIGDNYHPENSHVIPALIRRFHEAKVNGDKSVTVWGTGNVRREFLFADDLADACVFLMNISREEFWTKVDMHCSHVNVGCGEDITIRELAELIKDVVGFEGDLEFDYSKPDGSQQKRLNIGLISEFGWSAATTLFSGLNVSVQDYVDRTS
ncbi:GDP-L-fucose synthase family protein [Shewanella sp.]|uniref:GDP-L-fucose synthase family protein n=1 Tax=Shewanella sp. TaxID=50422 RepID=UPI00404824FB